MHKRKRRKRVLRAAALALFALLCALAAAAVFWLYTNRAPDIAVQPQGAVCALRLSPEAEGLAQMEEKQLDAFLDGFVSFARASGMNAVAVDADPVDGCVMFRTNAYGVFPAAAQSDTLTHRYDPLAALCEKAADSGLGVYAICTEALSDETARRDLEKRYALTDILGGGEFVMADLSQLETLYAASCGGAFTGCMVQYAEARADEQRLALAVQIAANAGEREALLATQAAQTLAVSYPSDGAVVSASACYVMGTASPDSAVLVNGQEASGRGVNGVFGALVNLAEGENVITVQQDGQSVTLTVTRPAAQTGTGSGGTSGLPSDGTEEVEPGTAVRTTGWLTSLLYDPSSDGNINETVRKGAVDVVRACVETVRSGKKTWAYQLSGGDYILATNVEVLDEAPEMVFTGASAVQTETGETLTFTGSGTPLAYTTAEGNTLSVRLYGGAQVAQDFAVTGSSMVTDVQVNALENGTEILFAFASPLYGHSVEYADGTVQLLLKRTPSLSDDARVPLAGVRVLLDPGHGAQDIGAMGVAGTSAPCEKDVNLAVALAAREQLEAMGATVLMTREDDSFPTLVERNQRIIETQPDFFISVHHNSLALTQDTGSASGTEAYYFYNASEPLAQTLVQRVSSAAQRPALGAKWGYYYVTRSTVCPAVLLETGFMVNPSEYAQITQESNVRAAGAAIAMSVYESVRALSES